MSRTITQTVSPLEILNIKLRRESSSQQPNHSPHGAHVPALRLDSRRALEPDRRKLTTLESQRIMAILDDSLRKTRLMIALAPVLGDPDRYRVAIGSDLAHLLETHRVIIGSFEELKAETERLLKRGRSQEEREEEKGGDFQEDEDRENTEDKAPPPRPVSARGRVAEAMRGLNLVASQMNHSCRNILRAFSRNPSAVSAVLQNVGEDEDKRSDITDELVANMRALRDLLLDKLLISPVEDQERQQYLREVGERSRLNAIAVQKLEADLNSATEDRDNEVTKKNDVIRRVQADIHRVERSSEEAVNRMRLEAEKQSTAEKKNSENRQQKLLHDINGLEAQKQNLIAAHRESEQALRRRKFQLETEIESWIQKYDKDMGAMQDEYEEIDAKYTEEKKLLNELEERFKTLETEYDQIMSERRAARERAETAQHELQLAVRAALTIQAFWRSYKVRRALKKNQKKKKGKGKGKGKGSVKGANRT